jgi:dTDP-4-amino-4,6-dideoxygalactose transaminase
MTASSKIPFLDLITPHVELEGQLVEAFRAALRTAGFIGGPAVEGLEKEFAEFCETRYSIAVSSGTDALRFALMAAGVKEGDVVVTVPMTFIATTEAITQSGARAVFVDVDPKTYTMDPAKLKEFIENQCNVEGGKLIHKALRRPVTAVVPVHLYGQIADMDAILELAAKHKLIVVEDACQAHGAEYFSKKQNRWMKAGSMGQAAAFSFYPGKNLGACGEGGATTTNDEAIAKQVRMLRDHGQSKKYYHDMEGYNGRLDSIQAAILRVKLPHLADWNNKRRAAAVRYNELLAPMAGAITIPNQPSWSKSIYHIYAILTTEREKMMEQFNQAGIGVGIHYPIPVHLQTPYKALGYKAGDYPVSERIAAETLSLPMFPGLTPEQQKQVAECVSQFLAQPSGHSGKKR